jgi:protein-disulfide isomerase
MKKGIFLGIILLGTITCSITKIYAPDSGVKRTHEPTQAAPTSKNSPSHKVAQLPYNGLEVSIGSEHAPITVIMYYSLTCPHCHDYQTEDFPEIKKEFIDKGLVRFVFRDFPTDTFALKAAKIAWCHGKNQYLAFSKKLLSTQDKWAPHDPKHFTNAQKALDEIVRELGIAPADYEKCIAQDTDTEKTILRTSFELQKDHDIHAAPAFLINGKIYEEKPTAKSIHQMLLDMGIHG